MTAPERTYVTFTFNDKPMILPSMFEASTRAVMSGNIFTILNELVPNPDQFIDDLSIQEFARFVDAWTKASEEARPKPQPAKPSTYSRVWHAAWLVAGGFLLLLQLAALGGVDLIGVENRMMLAGIVAGGFAYSIFQPTERNRT